MTTHDRLEFELVLRRRAFVARCIAVVMAAIPWGFATYYALRAAQVIR